MPALTQSRLLASIPGLTHGFTNLSVTGEEAAALDAQAATAKQVHKADIVWVDSWEKRAREADGVATLKPGLAVGVYSADCTPVLLAAIDESTNKVYAVMAVHAGWRGTAQGIAGKGLRELVKATSAAPTRYVAAVGPCISFESFEVGEEVAREFPESAKRFLRMEGERRKFLVDLPGENTRQLREASAGAKLEIDTMALCTLKLADTYPSYRRQGANAGRILSFLRFAP